MVNGIVEAFLAAPAELKVLEVVFVGVSILVTLLITLLYLGTPKEERKKMSLKPTIGVALLFLTLFISIGMNYMLFDVGLMNN